jgi:uncharacterized protein YcbK (DUF882 family)
MKNFKKSEFTNDGKIVFDKMNHLFLEKLDKAREYSNVFFILTSSWSTPEIDKKNDVKRKKTSSHYKGIAVDISAKSSNDKFEIVTALLKAGFTRIGIGSNFVHVDNDMGKVQYVIWTY